MMTRPKLTVVDVRRAFLLPLTKGAQAGVSLVEDELNKITLWMKRSDYDSGQKSWTKIYLGSR